MFIVLSRIAMVCILIVWGRYHVCGKWYANYPRPHHKWKSDNYKTKDFIKFLSLVVILYLGK